MGGWGSTRWGEHRRRRTVEETTCLPVGSVVDTFAGAGCACVPHVIVTSADGHQQVVEAKRTRQPFGGWRWLIVCPQCGRGCTAVYRPGSEASWACRRCHRLGYHTQRLTPSRRLGRRLEACWQELGGCREDNGTGPKWPRRPKGMHRATYWLLQRKYLAVDAAMWDEMTPRLTSVLARFGVALVP